MKKSWFIYPDQIDFICNGTALSSQNQSQAISIKSEGVPKKLSVFLYEISSDPVVLKQSPGTFLHNNWPITKKLSLEFSLMIFIKFKE